MHVIDQLERERGVLLDQQDREPCSLSFPIASQTPWMMMGASPSDGSSMIRQSGLSSAAADGEHLLDGLGALVASLLQAREQRIDARKVPAVTVGLRSATRRFSPR